MLTALLIVLWFAAVIVSGVPALGRWVYVRIPGIEIIWQLESLLYPGPRVSLSEQED